MPDWTPPSTPPALQAPGTWVALTLGATQNLSTIEAGPRSGLSWPVRGRLAFPAGRVRGHLLADLDANGSFNPGYNLAHGEAAAGFDLADGTHLLVGLGGDATRGGVAVGPLAGFHMTTWTFDGGSKGGIQGVITLPVLETGDLTGGGGFPAGSLRLTALRTWPTGPGAAFMLEAGLQAYRQARWDFKGFTRAEQEGPPVFSWRNQLVLGLWGGWAFGGTVR